MPRKYNAIKANQASKRDLLGGRLASTSKRNSQHVSLPRPDVSQSQRMLGDAGRDSERADSTDSTVGNNYILVPVVEGIPFQPRCEDCGVRVTVKRIREYYRYSRYCKRCSMVRIWEERHAQARMEPLP